MTRCPICDGTAASAFTHPAASILKCRLCTHLFTDPLSIRRHESYGEDYYDQTHRTWFENPNVGLFQWIESRIPAEAGSLLDVGCGKADFLRFVRRRRPGLKIVGVDFSAPPSMEEIELRREDFLDADIKDRFDAVVSLAAIEHVLDLKAFLQRLRAICNRDATVCIMTVNNDGMFFATARLLRQVGVTKPFDRLYDPHHLQHFSIESLHAALDRAGFEVVETLRHNAPLKSLDVPEGSAVGKVVMRAAVASLLGLEWLARQGSLQTVVARLRSG